MSSVPCLYAAFQINSSHTLDFLVDTGASLSLLPLRFSRHFSVVPSAVKLSSVEGKAVPVHGECLLTIGSKDLRRSYKWCFVIADIANAIIGADFLAAHKLSVSCSRATLTDDVTGFIAACKSCSLSSFAPILAVPASQPVAQLLSEFSSVLQPVQFPLSSHQSGIPHVIDTGNNRPVFSRPRQLRPELLNFAKEEFKKLMEMGIIRESSSSWSSPLHMVKKGDGSWRPCGDYRALNAITSPDRYPVPHIHHLMRQFHNCSVFSKIDLVKAYHQVPVSSSDIEKTAITTPFGLFEYVRMPFGLRNASQTFQRYMDSIFRDLPFVVVYIDDILVASSNKDEHINHLRQVLQRLSDNELRISVGKSEFILDKLSFLGFHVSASGVQPGPANVEAIKNYPIPTQFAELRRFIGMASYYRRFIPLFADMVAPLQDCITAHIKNPKLFTMTTEAAESFQTVKDSLQQCATLKSSDPSSPEFQLVTDASGVAIGSALHQKINGEFQPVAFFSRRLTGAQKSYSAFDRELLAAYLSVIHFKPMIEGQHLTLITDHKPLTTAFRSQTPSKSDRQQRQISMLTEYVADVLHVRGKDNVVADALSRGINSVQIDPMDLFSIARQKREDGETKAFGERLKKYTLSSGPIMCVTSTMAQRLFLPEAMRRPKYSTSFIALHTRALSRPSGLSVPASCGPQWQRI